jgi:hypothetical protein
MPIFATPDWGGAALGTVLLVIVSAVIVVLAIIGVACGRRLLNSTSSTRKKSGVFLLILSVLFPIICFVSPPYVVRLEYGNYPLGSYPSGKINEGMSFKEVEAILGKPHRQEKHSDGEEWIYWLDSFALYYCGVDFGPDGRVIAIHGN